MNSPTVRKRLLFLGGIALSILFLWLALRNVKLADVWQIGSQQIDGKMILWALIAYALFFVFKTYRWHLLLSSKINLSTEQLIPYVMLGYAGNILLPFQAGEITRAILLSRRYPVAAFTALSTIALEKIFDLLMVLIFLLCSVVFVTFHSDLLNSFVMTVSYLILLAIIPIALLLFSPPHTRSFLKALFDSLPSKVFLITVKRWIEDAIEGVTVLRKGAILLKVIFLSVLTWLAMLTSLYLTLLALNIEISLAAAAIVLFLSAVGMSLPTAPGFIGTIQAAFVVGLLPFGISQEESIAASLLYNLLITVVPLGVGIGCFISLGISFRDLRNTVP